MDVKIKKLVPEAIVPAYSRSGDAGMDMTATSVTETEMYVEYGTGLAMAIPVGYVGLIYPRSSLSNYDLILANHVGVVDSNYRGEVKFRFKKSYEKVLKGVRDAKYYSVGDRIGQIIIQEIPTVNFEVTDDLDETNRGANGYGSSGV